MNNGFTGFFSIKLSTFWTICYWRLKSGAGFSCSNFDKFDSFKLLLAMSFEAATDLACMPPELAKSRSFFSRSFSLSLKAAADV